MKAATCFACFFVFNFLCQVLLPEIFAVMAGRLDKQVLQSALDNAQSLSTVLCFSGLAISLLIGVGLAQTRLLRGAGIGFFVVFSILIACGIAFRFLQFPLCIDDAYIDFRYILNLLRGVGLIYQYTPLLESQSHNVLGISSPLHIAALAVACLLFGSTDVPQVSRLFNLGLDELNFLLLALLTFRITGRRSLVVLAAFFYAFNSYSIYEVARGKESPLLVSLLLSYMLLLSYGKNFLSTVVAGLIAVTRPEGVFFLAADFLSRLFLVGHTKCQPAPVHEALMVPAPEFADASGPGSEVAPGPELSAACDPGAAVMSGPEYAAVCAPGSAVMSDTEYAAVCDPGSAVTSGAKYAAVCDPGSAVTSDAEYAAARDPGSARTPGTESTAASGLRSVTVTETVYPSVHRLRKILPLYLVPSLIFVSTLLAQCLLSGTFVPSGMVAKWIIYDRPVYFGFQQLCDCLIAFLFGRELTFPGLLAPGSGPEQVQSLVNAQVQSQTPAQALAQVQSHAQAQALTQGQALTGLLPYAFYCVLYFGLLSLFAAVAFRHKELRGYVLSLYLFGLFFGVLNAVMLVFPWYYVWWVPMASLFWVLVLRFVSGRTSGFHHGCYWLIYLMALVVPVLSWSINVRPGEFLFPGDKSCSPLVLPIYRIDAMQSRLPSYEAAARFVAAQCRETDQREFWEKREKDDADDALDLGEIGEVPENREAQTGRGAHEHPVDEKCRLEHEHPPGEQVRVKRERPVDENVHFEQSGPEALEQSVAAGELGILGYNLPAVRIIDLHGIISPDMLKLYDRNRPYKPSNSLIRFPASFYSTLKPDWIIVFDLFLPEGLLQSPDFQRQYEVVKFYPHKVFGEGTTGLYVLRKRKDR